MNRIKKNQGRSIFTIFFSSVCSILFLLMCLLTILTTLIIFSNLDEHINSLLDRSLVVAWQEYNNFFHKTENTLSMMASLDQSSYLFSDHRSDNDEAILLINNQPEIDFWFTLSPEENIIAGNLHAENLPSALNKLAAASMIRKEAIHSSEVLPAEFFINAGLQTKDDFLINLDDNPYEVGEDDYYIEDNQKIFTWVLVRAVAVPVVSEDGSIRGCLLAGDIVNNNYLIPTNYSNKINGSYLSIGIKGVRVVSNIESSSQWFLSGTRQSKELVRAIEQGQRYSGEVLIEPGEIHLIASEPITSANGDIIGALSVGVRAKGLATVKRDTFFTILLFLAFCLLIALAVASSMGRMLSKPLASLTSLTKNIAEAQEPITPEQLRKLELESENTSRIQEINSLQHYLHRMAITIYQKSQETENYLTALEAERHKLHQLTNELQASNLLLEKKVAERTSELRKAVVELKALDNMKTKFLANMSHELRTPLNSVIGFSEMLYDEIFGELNPTQKDYVEIILNSARDLLQIISDILDLSRVEQGELSLDKKIFSVEELISAITTIIKPQIDAKNQTLTIQIEPDLPPLYADPVRIKQVLYNLLSNANKVTPPGGQISLKTGLTDGQVITSVSDNGIGIKKEHQDHIFEEFYQSESLYESRFEGVGLGLPLSKKLVELHNGKIKLESEAGKGTTVSFSLPVSKQLTN
ncbi:MAG: ATP-binding protein [Dethiobacteria bacterium]